MTQLGVGEHDSDLAFCTVLDNERVLHCGPCGRLRVHRFLGTEQVEHMFRAKDSAGFIDGTGPKEIWACRVCTTERIYGAPSKRST